MKRVLEFVASIVWIAALVVPAGCSGNVDGTSEPVLTADRTSISADGNDAVRFTVEVNGVDVTSESVIRCVSSGMQVVENAEFTATEAGNYSFEAEFDGKTSNVCVVSASEVNTPAIVSKFVRNICVMEFTGQWCAQCPAGYNRLWFVISRKYSDTAHIMALHNNTGGKDDMALAVEAEIFKNYGLEGYPAAVIDMRDPAILNNDTQGTLDAGLKNSVETYTAHCGVAVQTSGTETITVEASLFSEKSEEYRLAVWVIEDGIVMPQNVGGSYQDNYTHGHVVRQLVSSSWKGDSVGNVTAGQEVKKTFTIVPDSKWNLDKTSVYVLAIDKDGHVNNMAVCPVKDGRTDYRYVSEK